MKTYMFKGKEYVESGEIRAPKKGEIYLTEDTNAPTRAFITYSILKRKILIPKEGEMGVKYEILRDITPRVIFEEGNLDCHEFCEEYITFLYYLLYERKKTLNHILDQSDIKDIYENQPASWINFLVDNRLIRETIENTYHVGQRFTNTDNDYILSNRGSYVFLINLKTGNVWKAKSIFFNKLSAITQNELENIIGLPSIKEFKLIKE